MWFPVFGPEVTFQNDHFYKKIQKLLKKEKHFRITKSQIMQENRKCGKINGEIRV